MIKTWARGTLINVNFALATAEASITHAGIPVKAVVAASRLARVALALVRVQLAFCTIESRWAHAFVTPIEVTAHAADARRRVTLIDIDLALASFESFPTLAVIAISLIDTQPTIQARGIEAFVIILFTVDSSPPVDTYTEVRVVSVRVGVFALCAVLARLSRFAW